MRSWNFSGSLATAGNIVFSSVNDRLLAFRADTGEKLLELNLGTSQLGPPIAYMLDGKQYIAVAGGPRGVSAFGQPQPGLTQPAHLLVLTVDGKAPLPAAPAAK